MKGKDEILAQVTEFRRDLHRIPELGFFVYRTGAYVKNVLSKFDCRISTIAKTGILAFFDFGKKESICFRADMDALPIKEETSLPFASEIDGCMHACGHDGHMANALCFAGILNDYKKQGKVVNYNALILFQPAEETIDGAKIICSTDVFARYNVKAIFGLHVWPFLEKGEIATKPSNLTDRKSVV